MADLDERLARWRRDCAEALGGTAETLEELEGHLRDELARRLQQGEPVDSAFAAATARLGDPATLAAEFARETPPAPWLPVQLVWLTFLLLLGAGCWLAGQFTPRPWTGQGALLAFHVAAITLGYTITLLIGTLAGCYLLARLFGLPRPQQLPGLVRVTFQLTASALLLTGLGVVLGSLWASENLGRFWGWDVKETGAAAVLLWDAALLIVLSKRLLGDHAVLTLGLAGNAVVALAWFGPLVLQGAGPVVVALALYLLLQAALAVLGYARAGALTRRVRHG